MNINTYLILWLTASVFTYIAVMWSEWRYSRHVGSKFNYDLFDHGLILLISVLFPIGWIVVGVTLKEIRRRPGQTIRRWRP